MSTLPKLDGPIWPTRFFAGPLPSNGLSTLWGNPGSGQLSIITVIDVFYTGSGSSTLIDFGISGGPPFWGSAPDAGTVHTQQYVGLIILSGVDTLTCAGVQASWNVHVSGFLCNDPRAG